MNVPQSLRRFEGGIRILLIEDNEIDATFLKRSLLRQAGPHIHIDHVTSLAGAIQRLKGADYDVAVVDLSLPDAENAEAFEAIQAYDSRLPIVVLTGQDNDAIALQAIEHGAQDFLAKDHLAPSLLLRTLQFAIVRQQAVLGFQAAADHDSLTGMPNRRNLEAQFVRTAEHAKQQGTAMCFALLDIDDFKQINDRHGHCFGDAVLREVAAILLRQSKRNVLASRFGGEEFALLMPDVDLAQAARIVDSILWQLAQSPIVLNSTTVQVTASAGLVDAVGGECWDDVYARCDAALYAAKTAGKNRCRFGATAPGGGHPLDKPPLGKPLPAASMA